MPAYSIQFRRGTAADHSAFTGELAEITIDITNNRVVLHDGETAGGIPLAKVTDLPIDVGDLTDVNGHIAAATQAMTPAATWYGDRALFAYYRNIAPNVFPIDVMSIDVAATATNFGDITTEFNYSPMFSATSNSTYVLWKGYEDTLYYSTVATAGSASSFGQLSSDVGYVGAAGDGSYGAYAGGYSPSVGGYSPAIDYVSIGTSGSGTNFGNLTVGRGPTDAVSSASRQLFAGGYNGSNQVDTIDYITIANTGSAADFGNLLSIGYYSASWGDGTYGIWAGSDSRDNVIQYVTIDTTGNATDFGDLYAGRGKAGSSGHATRMLIAGGDTDGFYNFDNHVEYITTTTPGNGTDFAELSRTWNAEHLSKGGSGASA